MGEDPYLPSIPFSRERNHCPIVRGKRDACLVFCILDKPANLMAF